MTIIHSHADFGPTKIVPISEFCDGSMLKTDMPHKGPILYRWWFPENSEIMKSIEKFYSPKEIDILFEKMIERGITYYALYLGKGVNGRRRLKNHISPRKRTSTLRRTIAALIQANCEDSISEVLSLCYYEWCEFSCDKVELAKREKEAINNGCYPLNIEENDKIKIEWKKFLQERRRQMQN